MFYIDILGLNCGMLWAARWGPTGTSENIEMCTPTFSCYSNFPVCWSMGNTQALRETSQLSCYDLLN